MLDQRTQTVSWGWLLALGILMVLIGIFLLGNAVLTTFSSLLFLGILLVVAAIAQFFAAVRGPDHGAHLLVGLSYALAGLAFLYEPLAASIGLTIIVGAAFVVVGALRIYVGTHLRRVERGVWVILSGVVSVIAGVMILSGLPSTGFWVIGFIIGVEALANGLSYILLALGVRHELKVLRHA